MKRRKLPMRRCSEAQGKSPPGEVQVQTLCFGLQDYESKEVTEENQNKRNLQLLTLD